MRGWGTERRGRYDHRVDVQGCAPCILTSCAQILGDRISRPSLLPTVRAMARFSRETISQVGENFRQRRSGRWAGRRWALEFLMGRTKTPEPFFARRRAAGPYSGSAWGAVDAALGATGMEVVLGPGWARDYCCHELIGPGWRRLPIRPRPRRLSLGLLGRVPPRRSQDNLTVVGQWPHCLHVADSIHVDGDEGSLNTAKPQCLIEKGILKG